MHFTPVYNKHTPQAASAASSGQVQWPLHISISWLKAMFSRSLKVSLSHSIQEENKNQPFYRMDHLIWSTVNSPPVFLRRHTGWIERRIVTRSIHVFNLLLLLLPKHDSLLRVSWPPLRHHCLVSYCVETTLPHNLIWHFHLYKYKLLNTGSVSDPLPGPSMLISNTIR